MEVFMKRLVKYSLILILIVCVILVAVSAVLQFVNLDPFRERIAGLATEALGRQVKIDGHIDINLFPHPEIILNEISLANASWSNEPIMATVNHADAAISFLSLFSDTIIIRRLRLSDVSVLLEKNKQNIGNWVMGKDESSEESKPEKAGRDTDEIVHLPVMVDLAEFKNVTLTMRPLEGAGRTFVLSSFSLQPDESGNLILNSAGKLLDKPIKLNAEITSEESVTAHKAVDMGIQGSLGDIDLTGRISTSRLATLADLRGSFKIAAKDIRKTLKMARIDAPLTGPLTADVTVNADGQSYKATTKVKVEDITVTVGGSYANKQVAFSSTLTPLRRAGDLFDLKGLRPETLTLKGKVKQSGAKIFDIVAFQADAGRNLLAAQGRITTGGDATLSMTFTSPDLNSLLGALPKIDLKVTAKAQHSAEKIAVSGLALAFDKSSIEGDIEMLKGKKQKITANLTSKLLDLRPFSKGSEPDDKTKQQTPTGTGKGLPEKKSPKKEQYIFKAAPLQLAALQSVEADAKVSIGHLFYDLVNLKAVKIDAAVHDGQVDAKFKCDSANEGHAAGKIDLKTKGQRANVNALLSVSGFRLKALQAEGVSQTEVPPVDVSMEIQSAGSSPRELAAAANGRLLLTQGPGKIKNTALAKVSGDILSELFSALNPFAKHEIFSHWDCSVLKVDIVDGLAKIDTMLAQGEKVMIVGSGDIDLKTEKLNIEFNTKPRKGVGISADMFVTPFVKVKGTMASPSVGLNKKGTLLTGGAAVATGGLSLILKGVFDRATAEGNHCDKALETVGQHSRYDF